MLPRLWAYYDTTILRYHYYEFITCYYCTCTTPQAALRFVSELSKIGALDATLQLVYYYYSTITILLRLRYYDYFTTTTI